MAETDERVTIRGHDRNAARGSARKPGVWLERWPGGLAVSHGYGWFLLDPAEWERFKAEGDRLMAGSEADEDGPLCAGCGDPAGPGATELEPGTKDGGVLCWRCAPGLLADDVEGAGNG